MFREPSRPKCLLETQSLGYVSLPPVQMHMLWEEHTANHLSIDNSESHTGLERVCDRKHKREEKVTRVEVVNMGDVHEKTRERIWDRSAHMEEDREEPNQTPYTAQLCQSWPCSPQHFRSSSHLYLSLRAKSLIVYSIFHFLEDKSPLIELACSEWYSSFQKSPAPAYFLSILKVILSLSY